MNTTQKTILTVTVLLLSFFLFIIFSKVFRFERYKTKTEVVIEEEVAKELYSYLPDSNDYEIATIYYGHYASFNSLFPATIEQMVIDYLLKYESTKVDRAGKSTDDNQMLLYKISQKNLNYALKKLFGDDKSYKYRNANIDYHTRVEYKNNYMYVYDVNSDNKSDYIVYRDMISYSSGEEDVVKIYDYYLKCNKVTRECFEDEQKETKSIIKYIDGMNVNDYVDKLAKYEHIFKKSNDHYYWVSSSKM